MDYYYKDYIHVLDKPVETGSHILLNMYTVSIYALKIFKLVIFSLTALFSNPLRTLHFPFSRNKVYNYI